MVYVFSNTHDDRPVVFGFLPFLKIERQALADWILVAKHLFAELLVDYDDPLRGPAVVRIEDATGA